MLLIDILRTGCRGSGLLRPGIQRQVARAQAAADALQKVAALQRLAQAIVGTGGGKTAQQLFVRARNQGDDRQPLTVAQLSYLRQAFLNLRCLVAATQCCQGIAREVQIGEFGKPGDPVHCQAKIGQCVFEGDTRQLVRLDQQGATVQRLDLPRWGGIGIPIEPHGHAKHRSFTRATVDVDMAMHRGGQ